MANDKNYYEVLGVEPDADVTIIKRRYRQLVRANHPDIAPDRDAAHQRMLEINAAWTILSDPSERARYDRARRDPLGREKSGSDGPVVSRATSGADAYINQAANRARAGQGSASTSAPRAAPRSSRNAARGSSQSRTRLLTMVFEAAELYFFQGRAEEAIEICERVIKADPHNAEAPALLGDIYAEQGRKDVAVQMYQAAVRNQPNNALYRQKLSALGGTAAEAPRTAATPRTASTPGRARSGAAGVRSPGGTRPRIGAADPNARSAQQFHDSFVKTQQSRSNAGMIMLAVALVCLAIGNFVLDPATFELPMGEVARSVGGPLIVMTAVGALLVGVGLPLLGLIGPCAALKPRQPKWQGWPLYIALIILAVLCYPVALVVVSLMYVAKRDFDRSWIIVALATLAWSCTMALKVDDAQVPAVLANAAVWWSGRLVYPAMAFGWVLGSAAIRR